MSTLVALVPRQLPRGHFVPVRAANEDCYSCLTGARVVQVQTLAQPRPNLGLDDWVQIRTQWDVTLALNGNGRMCEYARLLVISVTCRDGLYTSNDRRTIVRSDRQDGRKSFRRRVIAAVYSGHTLLICRRHFSSGNVALFAAMALEHNRM